LEHKEYKVELEIFEGPLDLLLYLIKKDEVDIYDIPIELITNQYMQYLDVLKMLDLNIAGDFLVMAATLMMIKSRMLLPVDERSEEEEEEEDPRWDLVRQLVEYKKFKDAALHLEEFESVQQNIFAREGDGVQLGEEADMVMRDVNIFDLISAFSDALKNIEREDLREIFAERFTVAEKVDYIVQSLKQHGQIAFSSLFEGVTSRSEVVCTFLALLELIRLKQICARQNETFSDIVIKKAEEELPV